MVRIVILIALTAAPIAAQAPAPPPDPVVELPGAGRPVAVAAYAARRQALAARIENAVAVIPAASERDLEEEVIQDNDFRQNDYFFYLTGIETPSAWLMLAATETGQRRVTLFLPERNPQMEQWTGRKLGPGTDAARLTGIADVRALVADDLGQAIRDALDLTGGPLYSTVYRGGAGNRLAELGVAIDGRVRDITPILDSMRVVKDSVELAALRRAIYITTEAHKAAMRAARPEMYEYQLEATIEYTFRNLGADRVGFPSIVGSGPNSTVLHYDTNRRKMEEQDLVVMDIGAEYGQYTADVTRTIPVGGTFTARQRAVYNLVLATQRAAMEAIRPGVTFGRLNEVARRYMRDHSGDLCGVESCDRYFIHGLSHWLGMRVHDVGGNRRLEPGMVFTVEPGIYMPAENLGVRIEDDVLVTEDGYEILSDGAPRTIAEIESLMGSGSRPKTDGSGK